MQKRFASKHWRWACTAILGLAFFSPPVKRLAEVPAYMQVPVGQQSIVHLELPHGSQVTSSDASLVEANTVPAVGWNTEDIAVSPHNEGEAKIQTRLFGFIPWKTIHVQAVHPQEVVVGGQTVGIRLQSNGVMVVGFQRVGASGSSPAMDANVHPGDVIEEIGHQTIHSAADVHQAVSDSSGPLTLHIRRGNEHLTITVSPAVDNHGFRHLGLYVREKTSGVGTLTYYNPENHRFGALGHVISDSDTGQPIVGTGGLFDSEITGMVRGQAGKPGEKRGRFVHPDAAIGHIDRNTSFGIFGIIKDTPSQWYESKTVPVASPDEVHEGPATMLTVVHGQKVEPFQVEIENLVRQEDPNTKSMIVHVTDPTLLNETGGIVQGMSGSPLLQDGKLVGAVTHVFVSDPTRGYGVYAAWMVKTGQSSTAETTNARQIPQHLAAFQHWLHIHAG